MSLPSNGNYIIYNRVMCSYGDKNVITYPGSQNKTLTVSPLRSSPDNTQIVSLHACFKVLL